MGHDYQAEVTAPDCVNGGYTTYTCACGDSYVGDYTDALGHTAEVIEGYAPTCTETGLTDGEKCSVCDEILTIQEVISALGHDYQAEVTAPDCVNGGYTTYTCACGDSYVGDYTDALGHTSEVIEGYAPTCTETGLTDGSKCSVCGEILVDQQIIPATGHAYDDEYDAECNNCGFVRDALCKHDYIAEVTAPDCVNGGYTTYTCACGDSYVGDYTDALGHDYQAEVTAPDCVNGGYTTYTCANCGDSYVADYTDALGHTSEVIEGYAPTCTEDGLTDGEKCSVCGEILTAQEVIPATGEHVYDNDTDTDCNDCGYVRPVVIRGDSNGDGKVNNRDLAMLQLHLNGRPATIVESAIDLNADGKINNRDLAMLQLILNGKA